LKLTSTISLTNLHLYNEKGIIIKYDYPEDILEDFYEVRYKIYEKRIQYMVNKLKNLFNIIDYKIKYIESVIDKTIKVQGNTRTQVIDRLEELEFPKSNSDHLAPPDKRTYKYLTDLSLLSLTTDKIAELKEERKVKKKEYKDYLNISVEDRWLNELGELELEYKQWVKISLASIIDDEEESKSKKKTKSKKKKL